MAQSLSNLPIGSKVKLGKYSVNGETAQSIIWMLVAKNHSSTPAYPSNSVTLLTERSIDLRAIDEGEPNNTDSNRVNLGNNRYSVSNIDQWLNKDSAGGSWYVAQHDTDHPPDASTPYVGMCAYVNRPGFLNAFTSSEKNAILSTTIRVVKPTIDGGGYEDISRKVFLLSTTEVGLANENNIAEGANLSYFNSATRRVAYITSQAYNNTTATSSRPSSVDTAHDWRLRTPYYSSAHNMRGVLNDGDMGLVPAATGFKGIRPALNLSSTCSISDTTDSEGCYTFIWNSAPPVPTTLNVPTIYGGKSAAISWSSVTDPNGDTVTYQLEMATDGGTYATIYSGTNLAYTTIVPFGTTSVQFRLKAIDSLGLSSGYITSTSRTVVNNNAPVISGTDGSLGTKSAAFTQTYTVTDANSNPVTVTEAIDGVRVRSYTVTLGNTNTFSVTGNTWLALANGIHTMTITATDGLDSSVRTYTFTKSVSSFTIQNTTAWTATTRPTRIKVTVNKTIPAEATLKIEVCNNGFDASPTWEDATSSMNSGLVYLFSNTTKTATNWGVKIRVTVNRNGGSGACYVSAIGGNFE